MHPDYAIGWFKTYFDGTEINGCDADTSTGAVSWRKSPEDGVKSVRLLDVFSAESFGFTCLGASLSDKAPSKVGRYWQSDEMTIGALINGQARRTKRRIMRQISVKDTHFIAKRTPESIDIEFNGSVGADKINLVPPQWVGKWLVLEIDRETKTLNMYFSDNII